MSPLSVRPDRRATAGVQLVGATVERWPQMVMWTAAVELGGKRVGWVFYCRDRQSHLRRWGARDTRGRRLHLHTDGRPGRGRDAIHAVLANAGWVR